MVGIVALSLALPASGQARSHFKPCVRSGRPVPFATYWLGTSFEALPLTSRSYSCSAGGGEPTRMNEMSYVYGDCQPDPRQDEPSCSPPLEVQTFPACDRNLSLYGLGGGLSIGAHRLRLRGVPAISVVEDSRLELFTGDVTVVIFADSRAQARRAAAVLERAPADRAVASAETLPPPVPGHLTGRLDCGLRFTRARVAVGEPASDRRSRLVRVQLRLPRSAHAFVAARGLSGQRWDDGFVTLGRGIRWLRGFDEAIPLTPGRWELTLRAIDHAGRTALRTVRVAVPPV